MGEPVPVQTSQRTVASRGWNCCVLSRFVRTGKAWDSPVLSAFGCADHQGDATDILFGKQSPFYESSLHHQVLTSLSTGREHVLRMIVVQKNPAHSSMMWWKSVWWYMRCRWHSCFLLPEVKAWQTWKLVTLAPSKGIRCIVLPSPTLWTMHGAAFIVYLSPLCTLLCFSLCFVLLFFCHGWYLLSFLLLASRSNVFC